MNKSNPPEDITAGDLPPHTKPGPGRPQGGDPLPAAFQRKGAGEGLPEATEMSLNEWLTNLWGGRYIILACLVLSMAYSAFYLWTYTPIYRVDAMLQIEANKRSMTDKALADIDSMFASGAEAQTELEIIRSNLVVGRAVETLGLDIQTPPVLKRYIGEALARRRGALPRAEIESFILPEELRGRAFRLVTLQGGTYRWETLDGKLLATGKPGAMLTASVGEDTLRLQVRKFVAAEPGQQFLLVRQPLLAAIGAVRGNLIVAERGKYTGILGLSYMGPDPKLAAQTLNEILNQYVKQNLERKSEEVSKTLAFLNQQLPTLKAKLEQSEDALNKFRVKSGSIDLSAEAQALLKQSVDLGGAMLQMKQKKDDLLRTYKENSDVVATLNEQYNKLAKEVAQVDAKVRTLPRTQQEVVALSRDVQLDTTLYTALLSNIQQLQVVSAGQVGNARIIDFATPALGPVKPNRRATQSLFLALGLGAGVGLVMLRMLLHRGIKDPHLIEQKLGLPVYVTIPHSEAQEAQARSIKHGLQGTHLLAYSNPDDIAIESLRSLRTTLHFTLADAANRLIVIAGPSPGIGKSFVSSNFAAVLAQGGGRVLLVDGDMRKGSLHHYFGVKSRKNGLSEVLAGQVAWEQVVHKTAIPGLEVIFSGVIPPNPSELLMKDRFSTFIAEVSEAYNYIIFDAPPMMAVTDALIIGAKAGTFLLMAKFGQHPLDEIRTCQSRCEDIGIHINGCIFNDLTLSELSDRYYRYGYHYSYK
ncbi:MAG: polysaccharide biosynthesis tyrosine autokinase [Holophagaceae bacterium]|nr:polysaccharide biosynthesis tyrosine autokinase [Holophagaceae bacterium]